MRFNYPWIPALLWTLASVWFGGCATSTGSSHVDDRKQVEQELSGEMSLKADREQLQDLRKEIPEERRKTNDELALYLQLMRQGTEQPQTMREKFTSIVQKKRQAFRDKVSHLRENYHRSEQKRREEYLSEQKNKRSSFMSTKRKSEETNEFYKDQDRERQAFFAQERERRLAFEAEVSAQSKDFDSYMREKNNEFIEQYRLYSKQFADKAKEKKLEETKGFNQMDQAPAKTLGTEN